MEILSNTTYNNIVKILEIDRYPQISDIDRDLLSLAFVSKGYITNNSLLDRLDMKYNSTDYEWLEFIGDSVLEMIMTTIVTEIAGTSSLSEAHHIRQEVVKNLTLNCLMSKKRLCKYILSRSKGNIKICADSFEAITGAIYYHLYYHQGLGYSSLDIIKRWLIDTWDLISILESIMDTGRTGCMTITTCPSCPVFHLPSYKEFEEVFDKISVVLIIGNKLLGMKILDDDKKFLSMILNCIRSDRERWLPVIDCVYRRIVDIAIRNNIV